ncbi:hypothetical protein XENTR_v10014342 [Xenopus tropicalis]|uniref:Uncharacterized LOC100490020 n=1 Tax=Xenopus tropicalis TaxID=8364 RepID=A0A803J9X2_XENTR|nr:uncharacterized protein LOC100490020 [Xenopus tropicalis]KAE8603456.1 hypothetical protein XENTR_v10014342 [Xenopus tropicalis]
MGLPENEPNTSEIKSASPRNSSSHMHKAPPARLPSTSKSKQGTARYGTKAAGNTPNTLLASASPNLPKTPVTAVIGSKSNTGKGRASARTGVAGKNSVGSALSAGKDKCISEPHPSSITPGKSPVSRRYPLLSEEDIDQGESPLFHPHPKFLNEDINRIEKETRGQRSNLNWHNWRKNRITASIAHQISHSRFANHKTEEIPKSYLKAVLGTGPRVQTTAMYWGIQNEKNAVLAYEKLASKRDGKKVKVEDCGLFIHPTKNWLAASPDGIVKDGCTGETLRLLEVKCPYKHKEHTIREACEDRNFCLQLNGDSYMLRQDHAYYTQVQCQLAATQLKNADFVVHTTKETAIVPVHFNPEFWESTETKLERFYIEAVLPKLQKQSANREEVNGKAVRAAEE